MAELDMKTTILDYGHKGWKNLGQFLQNLNV